MGISIASFSELRTGKESTGTGLPANQRLSDPKHGRRMTARPMGAKATDISNTDRNLLPLIPNYILGLCKALELCLGMRVRKLQDLKVNF